MQDTRYAASRPSAARDDRVPCILLSRSSIRILHNWVWQLLELRIGVRAKVIVEVVYKILDIRCIPLFAREAPVHRRRKIGVYKDEDIIFESNDIINIFRAVLK